MNFYNHARPKCGRCNKTVDRAQVLTMFDGDHRIVYTCHGRTEESHVTREELEDMRRGYLELPALVFWPGFSRYSTTTKPPRRVL